MTVPIRIHCLYVYPSNILYCDTDIELHHPIDSSTMMRVQILSLGRYKVTEEIMYKADERGFKQNLFEW
ncbi:hypothetical protein [Bacillus sp. Bos-x628]|uniref:hypothetical protein n=1 Tax=Bacillus maqinnsis TaxID=3229854 RepID=UPI00338EBD0E